MKSIENLLRSSIGLHAATIGASVVEYTICDRMRRLGLKRHEEYLELLRNSPAEWNTLVETMVVTETWFFREQQPFAVLARLVKERELHRRGGGGLRLLSVPCASGEEPYSMAMALLDAGIPASSIQIDAVDISGRALATAQRGIYGKKSFRGENLEYRDRHFRPHRSGFTLNAVVRKLVHFQRGNLLHENCLPGAAVYDFIFCRNLLIYFDRPTQNQALGKLRRLLKDGGALFTGSAELPLATANEFESLNLPHSFACRKTRLEEALRELKKTRGPARVLRTEGSEEIDPPWEEAIEPDGEDSLERARELAGTGRLAEAAELCETHLRERGVSAEAYFVLGLARDADGAPAEAGECYRKALYLEPDHLDTLRQWASLSERTGQMAQARILRQRAERQKTDKQADS